MTVAPVGSRLSQTYWNRLTGRREGCTPQKFQLHSFDSWRGLHHTQYSGQWGGSLRNQTLNEYHHQEMVLTLSKSLTFNVQLRFNGCLIWLDSSFQSKKLYKFIVSYQGPKHEEICCLKWWNLHWSLTTRASPPFWAFLNRDIFFSSSSASITMLFMSGMSASVWSSRTGNQTSLSGFLTFIRIG